MARIVSGLQILSSSVKTAALEVQVLGHGLDDEVDVGEVVQRRGVA